MERGRRWTVVLHEDVTAFKSEAAVLAEVAARLDRALTAREEALRASEERVRLIADVSSDGIWDWVPDTDEAFFSDHMRGILRGADLRSGTALMALLDPDDAGRLKAVLAPKLAGGGSF